MLIDVFAADPQFGERSSTGLREARARGALVACDVVWAEVTAAFDSAAEALRALDALGIDYSASTMFASMEAGRRWRAYRRGGGARDRVIGDFLVAAHAVTQADRLLTRDRGFYRSHFSGLTVVDPE